MTSTLSQSIRIDNIKPAETLPVRQRVLWPNKPIEFCLVDGDENATHFGAFHNDVLVGVASTYENDDAIRLRKFAVENHLQGKGIGTELLRHILAQARLSKASVFWCDAREDATKFYEKFGLSVSGERFYKSGLPYLKMSLEL